MLFIIISTSMVGASNRTESCQRAITKEECETLAGQLGIPDITAYVTDNLKRPPYCYYKPHYLVDEDGSLYFNTAVAENASPCTSGRKCVCTNDVQQSGEFKQTKIQPW